MPQDVRRHAKVVRYAWNPPLRHARPADDDRHGMGGHVARLDDAVLVRVAAVVGDDGDKPVLVRESRPRRDGVEAHADVSVGRFGSRQILAGHRIEVVCVSGDVRRVDEPQRRVRGVRARKPQRQGGRIRFVVFVRRALHELHALGRIEIGVRPPRIDKERRRPGFCVDDALQPCRLCRKHACLKLRVGRQPVRRNAVTRRDRDVVGRGGRYRARRNLACERPGGFVARHPLPRAQPFEVGHSARLHRVCTKPVRHYDERHRALCRSIGIRHHSEQRARNNRERCRHVQSPAARHALARHLSTHPAKTVTTNGKRQARCMWQAPQRSVRLVPRT